MKYNLEWNVFCYNVNKNEITTYNIFRHGSFNEYLNKAFKKCKTKDEFAETLRRELQYYFWSRAEYELIIEVENNGRIILKPWCGCRDPEKVKVDVTNDTNFNWESFANEHIKRQIYGNKAKIDIYDQIRFNWDDFLEYVWKSKGR